MNNEDDDDDDDLEQGKSCSPTFVWEFLERPMVWKKYSDEHQPIIETAYQKLMRSTFNAKTVQIKTQLWTYGIDFSTMVQTNLQHRGHNQRLVRRNVEV